MTHYDAMAEAERHAISIRRHKRSDPPPCPSCDHMMTGPEARTLGLCRPCWEIQLLEESPRREGANQAGGPPSGDPGYWYDIGGQ